jgi:hypothetical protein
MIQKKETQLEIDSIEQWQQYLVLGKVQKQVACSWENKK